MWRDVGEAIAAHSWSVSRSASQSARRSSRLDRRRRHSLPVYMCAVVGHAGHASKFYYAHAAKTEALRDGTVLLFVCSFVCSFVCCLKRVLIMATGAYRIGRTELLGLHMTNVRALYSGSARAKRVLSFRKTIPEFYWMNRILPFREWRLNCTRNKFCHSSLNFSDLF